MIVDTSPSRNIKKNKAEDSRFYQGTPQESGPFIIQAYLSKARRGATHLCPRGWLHMVARKISTPHSDGFLCTPTRMLDSRCMLPTHILLGSPHGTQYRRGQDGDGYELRVVAAPAADHCRIRLRRRPYSPFDSASDSASDAAPDP